MKKILVFVGLILGLAAVSSDANAANYFTRRSSITIVTSSGVAASMYLDSISVASSPVSTFGSWCVVIDTAGKKSIDSPDGVAGIDTVAEYDVTRYVIPPFELEPSTLTLQGGTYSSGFQKIDLDATVEQGAVVYCTDVVAWTLKVAPNVPGSRRRY